MRHEPATASPHQRVERQVRFFEAVGFSVYDYARLLLEFNTAQSTHVWIASPPGGYTRPDVSLVMALGLSDEQCRSAALLCRGSLVALVGRAVDGLTLPVLDGPVGPAQLDALVQHEHACRHAAFQREARGRAC